jgi:hypothetical protein
MVPSIDPAVGSRSIVFAVALVVFNVAHQLGDHVLQTDHQAASKADPGWVGVRAMAGHLFTYHLAAGALLVGTFAVLGLPLTVTGLAAGLAVSALTHGLLDRRWPVRAMLRAVRASKFAAATSPVCGMYQADQAWHRLALLVSALAITSL